MAGIGCFVCSSFNRQSVGRVVASTVSSAGPAPAVTTPSTPTPPPPPTPTSASPARRAGGPQCPGQDRAQHVVFLEMGCSPPPTASSWSGFWVSQGILILPQSSLSILYILNIYSAETGERLAVRGCSSDGGTLTADTELVRASHCGAFYFEDRSVSVN